MLSLITVLGWKLYQYDYEVAIVTLDITPQFNNQSLSQVLENVTMTNYTLIKINYTLTQSDLLHFPRANQFNLYVYTYAAQDVKILNKNFSRTKVCPNVTYAFNYFIPHNNITKFLMVPYTSPNTDAVYYNYWVPAVANAWVPVLVLILLSIWATVSFAQISVQTKFVKKE